MCESERATKLSPLDSHNGLKGADPLFLDFYNLFRRAAPEWRHNGTYDESSSRLACSA